MGKRNQNLMEMYSTYKSGHSLSDVGRMFGMTRQSVYGLFKYNGLNVRPKAKPLPFIMFYGEKYTIRNTGYYSKTSGKRTLLHRAVWEHFEGPIPAGWDIHHIDLDRTNNAISNLECLPKPEHTRKYSPHNNQYTKGKK